MTLKLYTDGHIALSIVKQLRSKGVDVERCEDVGLKDAADIEHLEYAVSNERTVLTQDADFLRLHKAWQQQEKQHCGIIRINADNIANIGLIVSELYFLHEAIEAKAASLENDVYNQVRYI